MWLTKNEKRVLKLLVDDSRLSDTAIASRLNISGQAIGKIRRKLESEIIKGYTLDLDLDKLDIDSISLMEFDTTSRNEKDSIEMLKKMPNVVRIYKLPNGTKKISAIRFNSSLEEFENENFSNSKISKLDIFPISNFVKNDMRSLFHKAIDDLGTKITKNKQEEPNRFYHHSFQQ